MPTEDEARVIKILSAIEIPPAAAKKIEDMGKQAITVVCEAALGSYPGLRSKIRTNAVALVGQMTSPQASETLSMLVTDANADVAIRAIRAVGRRKREDIVPTLSQILGKPDTAPILAAEAAKALRAIGSAAALAALTTYEASSSKVYPHRGSAVVRDVLEKKRTP